MFSHFPYPFLILSAFLFSLHLVTATRFSVSQDLTIQPSPSPSANAPRYIPLSPLRLLNQVFGFSSEGRVTATLSFSLTPQPPEYFARLALCQVSDAFVRGPNYQRRQPRGGDKALTKDFITKACASDQPDTQTSESGLAYCRSRLLCLPNTDYAFSVQDDRLQANEMYLIGAVLCNRTFADNEPVNTSVVGQVDFRNRDLIFPQLGFEEVLFPVFSAAIIVLLGIPLVILILPLLFAYHRQLPIRVAVQFVLAAVFLKLLGAILTFVHFFTLAETGTRQSWYLYVRLLLASSADIFFVIALVSISSGYAVMPNSWFVEDRSPIFLVYIGVVLQLLIIIAVKIMFPFQYLGAITYTIAGSSIALIACISSYRNSRFLYRFGHLIERSHIFLKSTPIHQLRIFYILNIGIAAVAYLIKIISVGLFDYCLNRPDLLWGTMEVVDAILLLWLAAFIFPRSKSPLYVDMSNLSNDRLHQAERWRARQTSNDSENDNTSNNSNDETTSMAPSASSTEAVLGTETSPATMPGNDDGDSGPSPADRHSLQVRLMRRAQRLLRSCGMRQRDVRLGVQPNTGYEVAVSGSQRVGNAPPSEPPWIVWTSGSSLPRPNSYTWRGRHRRERVIRQENNETPFLRTPIVVGSPEGSFDIVKLTVGIPVTGRNIVPKAFDEKGAEVSEPPRPGSSVAQPSTAVNEYDQHASGASRLDLAARFRFASRRQNRDNYQRSGEELGRKGSRRQGRDAEEAGPSIAVADADRDLENGPVTRTLSTSTTATCCDGVVSSIGVT